MEAKISSGGDFKNKDLHRIRFDSGGSAPYYTRPMAPGLPDRVDCARLAEEAAVLVRVYALSDLPRMQDLLADARGSVHASYSFARLDSGRAGAVVSVQAHPQLVCQRCLQGFASPASGRSEVEFVSGDGPAGSERELYAMDDGTVSLRDLAEEELLLALSLAAACSTPETCGRAPRIVPEDRPRPLAALQELLKKT